MYLLLTRLIFLSNLWKSRLSCLVIMTTEKVAEYFVVAGLTDKSKPLEEGLTFSSTNLKLGDHRKDPITDICIIDK